MQASPEFDRFLYTINDFTEVTGFDVEGSHVDLVVALTAGSRHTNDRIVIAVVATAPRIKTLVEQFRDASPRVSETRTFATLAEARAWIKSRVGT